jgi:hypothetical protein
MKERSGPFWDAVEGRAPLPRAAVPSPTATARDSSCTSTRVGVTPRPPLGRARDRVTNLVEDHVGSRIQENQMASDEAILKIVGKHRQCRENVGRNRRERYLLRVVVIDVM